MMLVFIDESGDPGFKVERGASPIFVAAMVIFRNAEAANAAQKAIDESTVRKTHNGEFKFNKCRYDTRDAYFQCVRTLDFEVRAIVVRKSAIYSAKLKSDKERFYEFFVKSMLNYDNGVLRDAKVVIDGSGDREFKQKLGAALRRKLGSGIIKEVSFKHSKNDSLVQLADMCVGAIARSYRPDRGFHDRWRKQLAPRISDVWDFI